MTRINVPAAPTVLKVDEALDGATALLYSPKAPLAGRFSPKAAAAPPDPNQVRADDRAVWVSIPAAFSPDSPEVLLYFHGHNYFVTASKNAAGAVEARVPDWMTGDVPNAKAKGTAQGPAGHFYKLDQFDPALPHHPLVLAPEDSHHTHDMTTDKTTGQPVWDGFWAKESVVGTLSSASGLGDLITDCFQRLTALPIVPTPSGGAANYLTSNGAANIKRIYLTGHSGGGVPLDKAAVSDIALKIPTTLCFLDATYNDYSAEVRKFCETWQTGGHLGNGPNDSCVVIIFNPASGTEKNKTALVNNLKSAAPNFAVKEIVHAGPADIPLVKSTLSSNPIVVIKTNTAHDSIPQKFIPLLLEHP